MAYSSGGLISATDFNGLATTNSSNIGWVWGTGWAQWGYGQDMTLLTSVSSGATVTATQWAGLVYTLNKALTHQGQTQLGGGPLGANINMTAGQTITYFANVGTAITQINTTGNAYYASGTTTTGSNFTAAMSYAGSTTFNTFNTSRTVTFSSANAARYFFNAGGRLQLVITATNNNATARSTDFVTMFQTQLGGATVFQNSSTPRSGTGGTLLTSNTSAGYYTLSTTPTTYANLTPNSATYTYNNDWVRLNVNSNNPQGTTGDRGTVITFTIDSATPAQTNSNFNDAVNVTVTTRVDIIYPETVNLTTASWGAPVVS